MSPITLTRSVTITTAEGETIKTMASITGVPQGPAFFQLAEDALINLTEDPTPEADESTEVLVVGFPFV